MAKIRRFEDIRAWQQARELVKLVYKITRKGQFSQDFGLRDQIRNAAGSAMHNIAEGFDAGSDAEFVRFLKYALRSCTEVLSQLYMALDQGYITEEQFNRVYEKASEARGRIFGFITYLSKAKPKNGIKEIPSDYYLDVSQN